MFWILLLVLSGCLSIFLASYSLLKRRMPGARVFAFLMFSVALYSFIYALELNSLDPGQVLNYIKFEGFWAGFTAPAFAFFAFQFVTRKKAVKPWISLLYFSIPLVFGILYLTMGSHDYVYRNYSFFEGPNFNVYQFTPGWSYIVEALYLILISIATEVFLLIHWIKRRGVMRRQIALILVAGLLPTLSAVLQPTKSPGVYINTQPFTLVVSGCLLALAMFRYQMLDFITAARNLAVDHIKEFMVLIDPNDRVIDINQSGKFSELLSSLKIGTVIPRKSVLFQALERMKSSVGNEKEDQWYQFEFQDKHYQLGLSSVLGKKGTIEGKVILVHDNTRLIQLMKELEHQAIFDGLTEIFNRRHLINLAQRELKVARRNRSCISFCIFDLDHFKRINDSYGHAVGDEVLKRAAKTVEAQLRPADIFGRFGGEEFCIILPGSNPEGALNTMERLREAIEELKFNHEGEEFSITASFGLFVPQSEGCKDMKIEDFLERADGALYKAKQTGRNKTVVYQEGL